jgi:hypothetical protein
MEGMKPSGPAAAAILAASAGCAVIGIAVVLATASVDVKKWMNWWDPAGPLTGKTGVGVIAWILAWVILHFMWRHKEISLAKVWTVSLILLIIGFAGTFPTIFEAFEPAKH